MDIYTGAIVAMHSSPSFDPNLFVFGISQDEWQLIRNDPMKPLVNKTLQGNYSPGSTIKANCGFICFREWNYKHKLYSQMYWKNRDVWPDLPLLEKEGSWLCEFKKRYETIM